VATNVLFADCSVRSFSEAVSPQVFEALATIAGGEDVAAPEDH
jgi:prepilin-type processing-associated H-X9-DG protein